MIGLWFGLLVALATDPARQEQVLESIIPGLAYGPACSSVVEISNVGSRSADTVLEAHRASGALVSAGGAGTNLHLAPGERKSFRLEIDEETTGAWLKVRERIGSPGEPPVIAAHGVTECVDGNRLRTVGRDAVFPQRNPWFAEDVDALRGSVIALINTDARPVTVSGCYSAGNLYSNPVGTRDPPGLSPICSETFEVEVPPFGSREFPVERGGNRWFGLKTHGVSVVLQMLRPVPSVIRMFTVDSTIKFGGEVP
jgi:hypothetical protein